MAAVVSFIMLTTAGAGFLIRRVASSYIPEHSWSIEKGNLIDGIELENVEFENVRFFPVPNKLRVQKIYLEMDGWGMDNFKVRADNARLFFPGMDPVVIFFSLDHGKAEGNVYARELSIENLQWGDIKMPDDLLCEIRDADIRFSGSMEDLAVKGSFSIQKILREWFNFSDSFAEFDLKLDLKKMPEGGVSGKVFIRGGKLSGLRTALIQINEGRIFFDGAVQRPNFDIIGNSRVEKIKIDIQAKGSLENPDLMLKSNKDISQERLLMMLTTNRTWQATEAGLMAGRLSPAVIKDFLGYFWSGYRNKDSWFGDWMRRISVDYDRKAGTLGVNAEVTDRLDAGYEVKRQPENPQEMRYKISGEYKVTDRLSVAGEKEFLNSGIGAAEDPLVTDDRILLKINQKF